MKEYFCIGSYLPFDTINKSHLNRSTAKQTFSFGRSERFTQHKANCSVVAYSSNEFKLRKEGAKIGSSQRKPFEVYNDTPDPARYRIKTEPNEKNIYIGMGRQHVKAFDYLNIESAKYPASTKYQIESNIKKTYAKQPIYTMRKKYPRQKIDDSSPGPVQYHVLKGKNANLSLTKYKSVSFSTAKSRRFQNSETEPPGPGAYKEYNFNGNQSRIGGGISRYSTSLGSRFPHAKRKSYIDEETYRKGSLPGPGKYKAPSEFGQYDGDIYRTFEFEGRSPKDIVRLDTDFTSGGTKKSRRPMTSKH